MGYITPNVDDWKLSAYPLVPGHEIAGTVTDVGSDVTHLQRGQRVGVGWQRSACLACRLCLAGKENLCAQKQATCVGCHQIDGGVGPSFLKPDTRTMDPYDSIVAWDGMIVPDPTREPMFT